MTIPVKLRRSGTTTATPSSLEYGEIAINYADGVVFYRDSSDVIQSFTFQAYALASHTHAASDITSGTLDAARLPLATTGAAGAVIVGTGLGVSSGTVSVTYGTTSGTACQGNDSRLSDARTPTAHKTSHATGGSDALTPSDIGAAPTASPAFTGAATVTNDGNVVPLTVTNTGTANSFVVNDASGDTQPFVIDADGNVGIGTSSPRAALNVRRPGGASDDYDVLISQFRPTLIFEDLSSSADDFQFRVDSNILTLLSGDAATNTKLASTLLTVTSAGVSTFSGQLLVTAGSASAPGVAISGDPNTGMYSPSADVLAFSTNQTERLLIDASGNIRINGAAAATSAIGAIHIKNGTAPSASITDGVVLFAADVSSSSELRVRDEAGNTTTLSPHAFPLIPDGPSEPMAWAYYSERDGRRINVDMLRVVRLLEQLTGEKLVYED